MIWKCAIWAAARHEASTKPFKVAENQLEQATTYLKSNDHAYFN